MFTAYLTVHIITVKYRNRSDQIDVSSNKCLSKHQRMAHIALARQSSQCYLKAYSRPRD